MKQRNRGRRAVKGGSWREHRGTEEGVQSSVLKLYRGVKKKTKRTSKEGEIADTNGRRE